MSKQTDFINKYAPAVIAATTGTSIFPSVKMAQMALETGYGDSIKVAANNAYGIRPGSSWNGKVISNSTYEEDKNGNKTYYKGTNKIYKNVQEAISSGADKYTLFRVYDDVAQSIKDHSSLLLKNHYAPALQAKTPEEQATMLQKLGYGTGTNYAETLIWIINKFNLKSLDEKKKL